MKKAVMVEWLDACSNDDWEEDKDHHLPPSPIVSIGFLIRDEPEYITICLSVDESLDGFSQSLTIPRGMIQKLTSVKITRKTK